MKELIYELNASTFLCIKSVNDLCTLFNLKQYQIEDLINHPEYREFRIPKKKGGARIISAPEVNIKKLQKTLNFFLQAVYLMKKPACSHGFILNNNATNKTYNIVSNAAVHANKKFVMNIDIENFFPNISAKRIYELFKSDIFGFNETVSIALSLLCTYKKQLPTGAPTSPVLSNFICLDLDNSLMEICSDLEINYTRYADDLIFSSDNYSYLDEDIIHVVKSTIVNHGFIINEKKFRIQSRHRQQNVTGIVVNKKVNVDRKYIRNLRAVLHHWEQSGLVAAAMRNLNVEESGVTEKDVEQFVRKIEGQINFVGMVRGRYDEIYLNLRKEFRAK